MQRVITSIAIYNPSYPRRQYIMNFWMNFSLGFYFDYDFWNTVFFPLRLGKTGIGAQRLTFRDEDTGKVLMEKTGDDVPSRMTGYWTNGRNLIISLGVKMRFTYNEGRDVYRTFPAMLDSRFFKPSDRDELLELSGTFWNAYNGFWSSELDKYVNDIFTPGSDMHFSQQHNPLRWCTGIEPYAVGLERRFRWITNP